MSAETDRAAWRNVAVANLTPADVVAGAVGGFVGSLLMGVFMHTGMRGTLEAAIPAMYGIEAPALVAGWLLHQWHGVFLGVVYVAAVANIGALRGHAASLKGALSLGVGYGVVTTLLPVLVMPVWLAAVGFDAPPFPNIGFPDTGMSVFTHVVYAVPVALAYYFVRRDG